MTMRTTTIALVGLAAAIEAVGAFQATTTTKNGNIERRGVLLPRPLRAAASSNLNGGSRNDDDDAPPQPQPLLDALDRAPCFDGACDTGVAIDNNIIADNNDIDDAVITDNIDTNIDYDNYDDDDDGYDYAGEAIKRLGQMSGPTVWSEFARIGSENPDAANLGQGFPDWLPPDFAVRSLVEAAEDYGDRSPHQYTRTAGHPNLVRELATRYSKHMGRTIDAMNEVAVTVGASQALYLCLQTLVRPGDEVILFEPFFDLYANQIRLAGGTPVFVPLTFVPYNDDGVGDGDEEDAVVTGGTWMLELEKLEAAVSSRTRAIVLNSPHNPTGKVFTLSEMESIAKSVLSAGKRCVVISDEVYKYIVHSPPAEEKEEEAGTSMSAANGNGNIAASTCRGHVHFASLPSMWDRTITVSSAGKTFSATGWQVGWCVGPSRLISPVHRLLPYVQFCASTVIQEALARTLPRADMPYEGHGSYYEYLNDKYRRKRDLLGRALGDAGFAIPDHDVTPGGGFFIFARITPALRKVLPRERLEGPKARNPAAPGGVARLDWALCQWMAEERGVLCIPSSPFFSRERAEEGASDEFIRVAFCKTDETIMKAATALRGLRAGTTTTDGDDDGPVVAVGDVDVDLSKGDREVAVAAAGVDV